MRSKYTHIIIIIIIIAIIIIIILTVIFIERNGVNVSILLPINQITETIKHQVSI